MNQLLNSRLSSAILILAGVIFFFLLNAVVVINPGQAGVLSILGKAQDGPLLEGLHWKPPFISTVDIYDVTVQKFEVPAESATKDLQDITASFAINFRLDPLAIVRYAVSKGRWKILLPKLLLPKPKRPSKLLRLDAPPKRPLLSAMN